MGRNKAFQEQQQNPIKNWINFESDFGEGDRKRAFLDEINLNENQMNFINNINLTATVNSIFSNTTNNSGTTDFSLSPSSFPDLLYNSSDSNKQVDTSQNSDKFHEPPLGAKEAESASSLHQISTLHRGMNPNGMIKCEHCMIRVDAETETYLLVGSRYYHVGCLECCICRMNLQWEETCFIHDSRTYCRDHYSQISSCQKCQIKFKESDMVIRLPMNAAIHTTCFKCVECDVVLKQGQKFYFQNSDVFCLTHSKLLRLNVGKNSHFQKKLEGKGKVKKMKKSPKSLGENISWPNEFVEEKDDESSFIDPAKEIINPFIDTDDVKSCHENNGMLQNVVNTDDSGCLELGLNENDYFGCDDVKDSFDGQSNSTGNEDAFSYRDDPEGKRNGSNRKKRIRTSFKHQQLRIMKSYFEINHNPDAKDLKQLSQKTGLPKRVLQVWFQNARAKYRRSLNGCEMGQDQEGFQNSLSHSPTSHLHDQGSLIMSNDLNNCISPESEILLDTAYTEPSLSDGQFSSRENSDLF